MADQLTIQGYRRFPLPGYGHLNDPLAVDPPSDPGLGYLLPRWSQSAAFPHPIPCAFGALWRWILESHTPLILWVPKALWIGRRWGNRHYWSILWRLLLVPQQRWKFGRHQGVSWGHNVWPVLLPIRNNQMTEQNRCTDCGCSPSRSAGSAESVCCRREWQPRCPPGPWCRQAG